MQHRQLCTCVLLTLLCCGTIASRSSASPEVPGAPQERAIALVSGTIHPVSGPPIDGGVLLFDKGKIVALGKDITPPANAERVDVSGKHIYPGLIDAYSELGLVEVSSVRGSRDQAETGQINPNVKAQIAFNPDSELIPVARSGGVLVSLSVPTGGLISGQSACMFTDGWTWEDMCLKPGVAMHVTWPQMAPVEAWWMQDAPSTQSQNRDRGLKTIRQAFADARAYHAAKKAQAMQIASPPPTDVRWEAMLPVLEGKMPLMVEADDIAQIQSAVAFAEQQGVKLIVVGGYDAPLCAELLKKHDVPVIVGGVHRLPKRRSDAYDAPFTVPERLRVAGVKYCISTPTSGSSSSGASNARNLPYHAGTAAAYGLPPEEALKAVTLYPAQILGVADRIGSLEVGKDATLIVTTGDPLDTPAQVTAAYFQGRQAQLTDRQKRLWEKYKEKYRRMEIKN